MKRSGAGWRDIYIRIFFSFNKLKNLSTFIHILKIFTRFKSEVKFMANSTENLQVFKATIQNYNLTHEVKYRFNHLIIEFSFDDLWKLFEFDLVSEELKEQFAKLLDTADVTEDDYISYIDVLNFIKQDNFFNSSLPLFTSCMIKAMAKLKELYSKAPVIE